MCVKTHPIKLCYGQHIYKDQNDHLLHVESQTAQTARSMYIYIYLSFERRPRMTTNLNYYHVSNICREEHGRTAEILVVPNYQVYVFPLIPDA